MSYLVSKAVADVRRLAYGTTRPARNLLGTSVDATTTAVVLSLGTSEGVTVTVPSLVSIDTEVMWVYANTATTTIQTLTVGRADLGSTAAVHTSGAIVGVNNRFPDAFIIDAIRDEVRSWQPEFFRPVYQTYSLTSLPQTVDIGSDAENTYGPAAVRVMRTHEGTVTFPTLEYDWFPMDQSEYPSGAAITFLPPNTTSMGSFAQTTSTGSASVRVAWACPFDLSSFAFGTDLVDDVGLQESMVDVATWGAAIRLLAAEEVHRSSFTAAGQPRDAAEVAAGAATQAAGQLRAYYLARMNDERKKMARLFPVRF